MEQFARNARIGSLANQKYEVNKHIQRHIHIMDGTEPSRETVRWREGDGNTTKAIGSKYSSEGELIRLKEINKHNLALGDRLFSIMHEQREMRSVEYAPGWRAGLDGAVIDCYPSEPHNRTSKRFAANHIHNMKVKKKQLLEENLKFKIYRNGLKPHINNVEIEKEYQETRRLYRIFQTRTSHTELHLGLQKKARRDMRRREEKLIADSTKVRNKLGLTSDQASSRRNPSPVEGDKPKLRKRGSKLAIKLQSALDKDIGSARALVELQSDLQRTSNKSDWNSSTNDNFYASTHNHRPHSSSIYSQRREYSGAYEKQLEQVSKDRKIPLDTGISVRKRPTSAPSAAVARNSKEFSIFETKKKMELHYPVGTFDHLVAYGASSISRNITTAAADGYGNGNSGQSEFQGRAGDLFDFQALAVKQSMKSPRRHHHQSHRHREFHDNGGSSSGGTNTGSSRGGSVGSIVPFALAGEHVFPAVENGPQWVQFPSYEGTPNRSLEFKYDEQNRALYEALSPKPKDGTSASPPYYGKNGTCGAAGNLKLSSTRKNVSFHEDLIATLTAQSPQETQVLEQQQKGDERDTTTSRDRGPAGDVKFDAASLSPSKSPPSLSVASASDRSATPVSNGETIIADAANIVPFQNNGINEAGGIFDSLRKSSVTTSVSNHSENSKEPSTRGGIDTKVQATTTEDKNGKSDTFMESSGMSTSNNKQASVASSRRLDATGSSSVAPSSSSRSSSSSKKIIKAKKKPPAPLGRGASWAGGGDPPTRSLSRRLASSSNGKRSTIATVNENATAGSSRSRRSRRETSGSRTSSRESSPTKESSPNRSSRPPFSTSMKPSKKETPISSRKAARFSGSTIGSSSLGGFDEDDEKVASLKEKENANDADKESGGNGEEEGLNLDIIGEDDDEQDSSDEDSSGDDDGGDDAKSLSSASSEELAADAHHAIRGLHIRSYSGLETRSLLATKKVEVEPRIVNAKGQVLVRPPCSTGATSAATASTAGNLANASGATTSRQSETMVGSEEEEGVLMNDIPDVYELSVYDVGYLLPCSNNSIKFQHGKSKDNSEVMSTKERSLLKVESQTRLSIHSLEDLLLSCNLDLNDYLPRRADSPVGKVATLTRSNSNIGSGLVAGRVAPADHNLEEAALPTTVGIVVEAAAMTNLFEESKHPHSSEPNHQNSSFGDTGAKSPNFSDTGETPLPILGAAAAAAASENNEEVVTATAGPPGDAESSITTGISPSQRKSSVSFQGIAQTAVSLIAHHSHIHQHRHHRRRSQANYTYLLITVPELYEHAISTGNDEMQIILSQMMGFVYKFGRADNPQASCAIHEDRKQHQYENDMLIADDEEAGVTEDVLFYPDAEETLIYPCLTNMLDSKAAKRSLQQLVRSYIEVVYHANEKRVSIERRREG